MQRITKLTAARIKKIMQEERQAIEAQLNEEYELQQKTLLEQLRLLKKVSEAQKQSTEKINQLNELKQKIIRKSFQNILRKFL